MSLPPTYLEGVLPLSTVVPENEDLFVPYFTRLYNQIATTVNAKDSTYFTIPISSTASNIPNIANFGSFIVCISGQASGLPSASWVLCKSDSNVAGAASLLLQQSGTGTWTGKTLTITSTTTNFQISHNNTNVVGNFNIRIAGTQ